MGHTPVSAIKASSVTQFDIVKNEGQRATISQQAKKKYQWSGSNEIPQIVTKIQQSMIRKKVTIVNSSLYTLKWGSNLNLNSLLGICKKSTKNNTPSGAVVEGKLVHSSYKR